MDFSSNHSCTYYPFGMEMPGRTYTNATLTQTRFGFNGQETVDEISGKGNHNTALFWEYDTRLGRRWNLDPVDQVSISNYAVNGNNPIWSRDPLGDSHDEVKKGYKNVVVVSQYSKPVGHDANNDKEDDAQAGGNQQQNRTAM